MKRTVLVLLAVGLLVSGCAKIVVKKVPTGATERLKGEGVFYALPKTVVKVNLVVERAALQAAPYMQFSRVFVPDVKPVCDETELDNKGELQCKDKTSYQVKQGATLATTGEPDPDNVYMVQFIGRGELDQAVTMSWTEAGVVTGAKSTVTNRTSDIVLSGVKLAAGIGTRLAFPAGAPAVSVSALANSCKDYGYTDSNTDARAIPILKKQGSPRIVTNLIENYCSIKYTKRNDWNNDDAMRLLEKATKAFTSVADLQVLRANALGDGTVMEPTALVQKLDTLIGEKLQALYLGKKETTPWEGSFEVRDLAYNSNDTPPVRSTTLLRIDKKKGFCVPDKSLLAPGVKPIPTGEVNDLLPMADCNKAQEVELGLSFRPARAKQLFSLVDDHTTEPTGDRSFYYRLPAQVLGEVRDKPKQEGSEGDGKAVYGAATMSIAQLGKVVSLPAKRNSKGLTYDLTYVEATGALKGFTLGTTGGLDAAFIGQISGVATGALDARAKSDAADKAAQDELTTLTREKNLLKLRDEICDLRKKYGLECDFKP